MSRRTAFVFTCLLVFSVCFCLAQQALTNDSIIKMAKAGLDENIIVQTINSQPAKFTTTADDLIKLKQAGVSDRVLAAMLAKENPATPAPSSYASALPPGVDEIGVYYKEKDGTWKEMDPEIINFKSGGFLKSFATDGIVKEDMNGHLKGASAKLVLTRPAEFLIYAPAGVVADEYQLLRLRVNSNNREFRSATGGVFHSSTGAKRDDVSFIANKIAPHLYEFSFPVDGSVGEYGILPPGSVSTSNAASGGILYTFKILE